MLGGEKEGKQNVLSNSKYNSCGGRILASKPTMKQDAKKRWPTLKASRAWQ